MENNSRREQIHQNQWFQDKRILTIIVIAFVLIIGVIVYKANHNNVLNKQNVQYEITGKNGYGTFNIDSDSELKMAKATANLVGKKCRLSKSQIGVVTDTTDADDIMDGTTAEEAFLENGNSKYHDFAKTISKITITASLKGKSNPAINNGGFQLSSVTSNLKNGNRIVLTLNSDSQDHKIRKEKYTIRVKGLKNPKRYKVTQLMSHVSYTFTGINGTQFVSVHSHPDSWFNKTTNGAMPPKPTIKGKISNGQHLTVNTSTWASNQSGDIKILANRKNSKVTVAGLTNLSSTNYKDILNQMKDEANKELTDSSLDSDSKPSLEFYKAYLDYEDGAYSITSYFKINGLDDSDLPLDEQQYDYKEVSLTNLRFKKGNFVSQSKNKIDSDDYTVTSATKDTANSSSHSGAITLPN